MGVKTRTSFPPGNNANPDGRPPKNRALTEILEAAGDHTVTDPDGKRIARKRFIARALWEAITEGKTTLVGNTVLEVAPTDWFGLVKFLYSHIDGPPPSKHQMSGPDDGPIQVETRDDTQTAARLAELLAKGLSRAEGPPDGP